MAGCRRGHARHRRSRANHNHRSKAPTVRRRRQEVSIEEIYAELLPNASTSERAAAVAHDAVVTAAGISLAGNEAISLTDTGTLAASTLHALDNATSGVVWANTVTGLTGVSTEVAYVVTAAGITPPYEVKRVGTAMLKVDDWDLEFVGARKESYQRDSRKPLVMEGSLEDDQNRRDFTINAMFYSPTNHKLVDFHDGLEDLKHGINRGRLAASGRTNYSN